MSIKTNYDEFFINTVNALANKPTLLLHACCAPCSSSVLERVTPHFETTLFYYNPNITDEEEYYKRLAELKRLVDNVYGGKIPIVDGGYCPQVFFEGAKGLEGENEGGARCSVCYRQRLDKTAERAKDGGFDFFCTTLSVSPYKNADKLNETGKAAEEVFGVKYLLSDFKKRQGYVRSIELSKELGLYRQDYCGCVFSKAQAEQRRRDKSENVDYKEC